MNHTSTTRRGARALIALALLGTIGLAACDVDIDVEGFSREAVHELAANTRDEVRRVSDETDRSVASMTVLSSALHRVVDLDQADSTRFQPRHSGLADTDGDGLDDDRQVQLTVDGASACLTVADDVTVIEEGAC